MIRKLLPILLLAGLLLAPGGMARAQGLVLGPDSAPLKIKRARALLIFRELGGFNRPEALAEDNPEALLVELELAGPAPAGALWLLSAPGGSAVRPAAAAALDEVSAYWRDGVPGLETGAWPAAGAGPVPAVFGAPEPGKVREVLQARGVRLDDAAGKLLDERAAAGWRLWIAEVPAGTERLSARLSFHTACALYPGALGAVNRGPADHPAWELPPLELMVLHSHFINVDDNDDGLSPRLGLGRLFQDGQRLDAASPWARPESAKGRLGAWAPRLGATSRLVRELAPDGKFLLTVAGGAARSANRPGLDFGIYSHYPGAVEPLPAGRSLVILAAVSVAILVALAVLLKRKAVSQ